MIPIDEHGNGDLPENTNDNPKSWIAWKREAEQANERAKAAERQLAAMLKLGENPSEEMISAGLAAEGHIDDEFKAMFAKLVEQAGVKK